MKIIMTFIKGFQQAFSIFFGGIFANGDADPELMDHVDVKQVDKKKIKAARRLKKAREEAAEKHGKQFLVDTKVDRIVPPSRDLVELQALSPNAKAARPVSDLSSRRAAR